MKLRYRWIFAFLVVLLLIAISIFIPRTPEKIRKFFSIQQENRSLNKTQEKIPITQGQKTSETTENKTEGELPGMPSAERTTEKPEAEKALTLELIDICSGKLDLFTVSEGATRCLNKRSPYYIILEKNSTHIVANLQGEYFTETYELNDSVLLFYIFAEDVASVSHEIQSFTLEGSPEFHLGEYYLHTIWERDPSGNLAISKIIVALSLYVDSNITASNEWKELKLYLNIPNKTYYLGNLWVLVKEK